MSQRIKTNTNANIQRTTNTNTVMNTNTYGINDPVSRCTLFFLSLQSQLRMYHWQTKSYARHKASDKLITKIVELSDSFVEAHIGSQGGSRPRATPGMVWGLKNLDDQEILKYLDTVVTFLTMEVPGFVNRDPSLLNIRDEMLSCIHQTRYLFTHS